MKRQDQHIKNLLIRNQLTKNHPINSSALLKCVLLLLSVSVLVIQPISAQEPAVSLRPVGGGYYELSYPTQIAEFGSDSLFSVFFSDQAPASGDLTIISEKRESISVDIQLAVQAKNRRVAERLAEGIDVALSAQDLKVELSVGFEPSLADDEKPLRVEILIRLPEGTALEIDARTLQLGVEGPIDGIEVARSFAPVEINGARGHLAIQAVNTKVIVENLSGTFDIESANGRISLKDIIVTDSTGQSSQTARAVTENADIVCANYIGPMNFRTSHGRIRGRKVTLTGERSSLRNSGGLIDIRFDKVSESASLTVRNSYEDVLLSFSESVSATFDLKTNEEGSIDLQGILHRIRRAGEYSFEAVSGSGSAGVRVTTKYGGNIQINGQR